MNYLILGLCIAFVIIYSIYDHKNSPYCKWCESRHYGRCIFNPRSGKIFANTDDDHFDYNDPNK